jgi:hypothetical protein
MAKTINQVLDRAFFLAGIKQEGIDLTESEYDSGIDHYNVLIAKDWAEGLTYPRAEVTALTDSTHLPTWAIDYIQCTVALRLCAEFNKNIPQSLPGMQDSALRAVESVSVRIPTPARSSILPAGGGEGGMWTNNKYFGNQSEGDLTDGNGSKLRDEQDSVLEDEAATSILEDL